MGKVILLRERSEAVQTAEAIARHYVDVDGDEIYVKLPGGELEFILSAGDARDLARELLSAADQAEGKDR